jgi:hypothetical protein
LRLYTVFSLYRLNSKDLNRDNISSSVTKENGNTPIIIAERKAPIPPTDNKDAITAAKI